MKKHSINSYTLAVVMIIAALSAGSCHKPTPSSSTGTFWFHMHTNIDTNEVDDTTALYRDSSGRHFGLNTAQFYISNIRLVSENGIVPVSNTHVLKNIDSEQYEIGNAPGVYTAVMFDVGLDDATNALAPAAFTTTGYIPNAGMWYGNTTQGYMNMKILGFADTTASQNGAGLVHFMYEIGAAANRKTVTMPTRGSGSYTAYQPYILTSGGINYIHIICDYGKLLSGIDFKTMDSTDTYNINPTLATNIANNIPNMFHYEE